MGTVVFHARMWFFTASVKNSAAPPPGRARRARCLLHTIQQEMVRRLSRHHPPSQHLNAPRCLLIDTTGENVSQVVGRHLAGERAGGSGAR